jgi:hypothetical protein
LILFATTREITADNAAVHKSANGNSRHFTATQDCEADIELRLSSSLTALKTYSDDHHTIKNQKSAHLDHLLVTTRGNSHLMMSRSKSAMQRTAPNATSIACKVTTRGNGTGLQSNSIAPSQAPTRCRRLL